MKKILYLVLLSLLVLCAKTAYADDVRYVKTDTEQNVREYCVHNMLFLDFQGYGGQPQQLFTVVTNTVTSSDGYRASKVLTMVPVSCSEKKP